MTFILMRPSPLCCDDRVLVMNLYWTRCDIDSAMLLSFVFHNLDSSRLFVNKSNQIFVFGVFQRGLRERLYY